VTVAEEVSPEQVSAHVGVVGLAVMGANLARNFARHGHTVAVFNRTTARTDEMIALHGSEGALLAAPDLDQFVASLERPRRIVIMVKAGAGTDATIEALVPLLEPGDIVVDGGNAHYEDTRRRERALRERGLHFVGAGISGGEEGALLGPSIMPGGSRESYDALAPLLEEISAKVDGEPCCAYMGPDGAGHFVKMVHNGIEYAIMQMISEAYDLLHRSGGLANDALHTVFKKWNEGQLHSYLIEITAEVFKTLDTDTEDPSDFLVDKILDQAGSKGTGKWTSQEAMDLPVSIPTIDTAVSMRELSVYKDQRVQAAKLYQPAVRKTEITKDVLEDLENALAFCFTIAYAQGLSMLAKASDELNMNIPLPEVIKVWKAGCIIRSALLGNFSEAFRKDQKLPNILLDTDIAALLKNREQSLRQILQTGIDAKIPMSGMMSALGYFDAYLSDRMPTNLIQAQRDFFGAHTYRRTDKEGVFHTEWHTEES